MTVSRRELMLRGGLLTTALWGGEMALAQLACKALAESTPRKLALLVGINQYPPREKMGALKGCGTDVVLQRELLIHRFGFRQQDILTLLDAQATRNNIEAAFTTHLVDQARPGDIVVFHFSGYGCRVRSQVGSETGSQAFGEQQALVPFDGWLSAEGDKTAPQFNGLYEDTLFLLLRSLLTEQSITVLDCGFQPSIALRCGSIRERSLPLWEGDVCLSAELALQDRLLQPTQLTRDQVQVQRRAGQWPGLMLAVTSMGQSTAVELDRRLFSSGLLSYELTQQLWANVPARSLTVQLGQLSAQFAQRIGPGTDPNAMGQQGFSLLSGGSRLDAPPQPVGIIDTVDRHGQTARLWLGGIPAALLMQYQVQSCFSTLAQANFNPAPVEKTLVQIRSRQGWTAIAQRHSGPSLQQGLWLEEAIRVLPRAIALRLGLGSNLSRIERIDATSVVSMANNSLQIVRSEQPADYVLTKNLWPSHVATPTSSPLPLTLPLRPLSEASYGLAYLGGALLPNTMGDRGEVVKRALERLQPTLDLLLALQLLELTLNGGAGTLRVSATLEQVEAPPQPLIRVQSAGIGVPQPSEETPELMVPKADKTSKILLIPNGTAIQYRISNGDVVPIYVLVVGVNSGTSAFASYAVDGSPTLERKPRLKSILIQPNSSILLPTAAQTWKASSVAGIHNTFLICTRQPLTQTLAVQANGMKSMLPVLPSGFAPLPKPLAIARAILADLHQASLPATTALNIKGQNHWALDIRAWVSLSLIYATV